MNVYKVVLYKYITNLHYFKKEEIYISSSNIFKTISKIYSNYIIKIESVEIVNNKVKLEEFE